MNSPRPIHPPLPIRVARVALFVVMAFIAVRSLILEPFGVPTGSMAGALLGNHREVPCPRCGFPVVVGEMPGAERRNPYAHGTCPNCDRRDIDLRKVFDIAGDRLLVDKLVYSIRKPRRWEIAVFRCPVDDTTPYVKRVVALPSESIQVLGGDLFIDGEIARKSLAQVRGMMLPVFDSSFEPNETWRDRWQVTTQSPQPGLPKVGISTANRPISDLEYQEGSLLFESNLLLTVNYRNRSLDSLQNIPLRDPLTYNAGTGVGQTETVHDFLTIFDMIRHSGTVSCRLTDGQDFATVSFDGQSVQIDYGNVDPPVVHSFNWSPSQRHRIEFAFVDRTIHLAIDGQTLGQPIECPADPTKHGRRSAVVSPVQFTIHGRCEIHSFQLFRDVHYRHDGINGIDAPYQLGPNDYFVLGDNSANSRDSRVWKIPGVPGADFIGKPFLIHQAMRSQHVVLNGQDRSYPTLDWQRLRWIR